MSKMIDEFNIKGMICNRCLKVLSNELKATGVKIIEIQLGRIVIEYEPNKLSRSLIEEIIHDNEFEIIWDKESILAEQTKHWVINYLWNTNQEETLSDYLIHQINTHYGTLSKNFSKTFGITIERFTILLKVERTKELIENGELNFSEIAYLIGYRNPSALSRIFKRETGMTLKEYKNIGVYGRIPLDRI